MLRCFKPKPLPSSPPPPPPKNNASPSSHQQQEEEEEEEEEEEAEAETASASTSEISKEQTPRSSAASGSGSASRTPPTLNLSREYIDAVQTRSYDDVWTKIHRSSHQLISSSSSNLVSEILEPNQESINAVLREATPNKLTRLVSEYFTNSEQTSHLCLLLHRSIERARTIYSPLHLLLQHLPSSSSSSSQSESQFQFSQSQCNWAVENFRAFMSVENPFPHPDSDNFRDMRRCFSQLRAQLDRRLRKARKKQRLIRRSGKGSALCLIGATVGLALSALIVATHALVALAAPIFTSLLPMGFAKKQLDSLCLLRRHIEQLDAAARGTYVLNNDLDTVDRLVARLHATVESDKLLIQLGIERGEDRYSIQEVVKQLRRNSSNLEQQLKDLEEHVCLCFVTVNRARSILLQEMFLHQHLSSS